jgi:flagellar biosynthesis/type III secretory pathway protein FliH
MFVFEDIVTLDNRAIQRVIRDVENDDLLLSLKVASEEVKDIVFSNMSQRMAETFKEEMEFMGPVRLRDVEEAQSRIVSVIRRLEEAGEIVIAIGEEMISLSNIIKQRLSSIPPKERRTISLKEVKLPETETELDTGQDPEFLLDHARQEAGKIYEKANAELEQVRRQIEEERISWETEREALIDQAKQEGFQAGFEQGKAEAQSTYQSYLDEANAIVGAARR